MTEAEWLAGADPLPMLLHLRRAASVRKLRLFGCACARRVWHLLRDERARVAVVTAECFADGRADEAELKKAMEAAQRVRYGPGYFLHGAIRALAHADR